MDTNQRPDPEDASGNDRRPAYLALAQELEARIRSGELGPGSRLPAQRDLAKERALNVSTISRAYRELQTRNLVVGSTRRGTVVTAHARAFPPAPPRPGASAVIDLTVNRPAVDDYLQRLAATLPTLHADPRFRELQEYQPPEGAAWARAAGARWIALNGFTPPPENVVVTSGAQHALLAALCSFIEPDDVVAADRLTYYGLKALAQMLHFRIIGLPSDADGLCADALDEVCRQQRLRAVFTVPCLQNPTVVTMSPARRAAVVAVAERHDVMIIEDDVYGPMLDSRPPAIATLAPHRTFHISSLSKALAPGLRVGYLLCPPGQAMIAAGAVRATAWMPAPLSTLVATRWIEDGTAEAILAAQLAELRARCDLVASVLEGASYESDPCCMFIWLRLPPPWRSEDFCANVLARGVNVMPATAFAADREATEHAVRVNLGCAASREELAAALRIIAATLQDRPRALFGSI
jgi:DNA-binding transcriptional MocR family regulator